MSRPLEGAPEGRFGVSVEFSSLSYPTREISHSDRRSWRVSISLEKGGGVSGELRWRIVDSTRRSRFASKDGKPHSQENRDEGAVPLHGTWSGPSSAIRIELERSSDAEGRMFISSPVSLTCVALSAETGASLLVCRGPESGLFGTLLRLPDTGEGRKWMALTDADVPYLVLGAAPGLAVNYRDERGELHLEVHPDRP